MLDRIEGYLYTFHLFPRVIILFLVSCLLAVLVRYVLLGVGYQLLRRKYPELADSLRKRLSVALILFLPVLFFNILLHGNKGILYYDQINHLIQVSFIPTAAIIIISITNIMEDMLYVRFEQGQDNEGEVRRIKSQVSFLKKIAVMIIITLAAALVLMSFEKVRQLGTSLLASAGVVGVVIGIAAQKSIANLLAGVEIAFNHSLKLDDFVVVENDFGRVEEINLTSVVVKLWDQRRMILPITYFTDRPFENWTRKSTEITISIFMFLDYKIPIAELRTKYLELVNDAPQWDGKVSKLIVTDFSERSMQVRATASAADPDKAFELRAYLRERLIEYINERFPEFLPRVRMGDMD